MSIRNYIYAVLISMFVFNPAGMNIFLDIKIAGLFCVLGVLLINISKVVFCGEQISVNSNKLLNVYVLLAVSSLIISSFIAISPLESLFGLSSNKNGAIVQLVSLLFGFGLVGFFRERKNVFEFFNFIGMTGVVMSVYAILQYFNLDPFLDINNAQYGFRTYATLGHPNFLGQFLIFPFFVYIFKLLDYESLELSKENSKNLVALFLLIIAIFITKNRATWIGIFSSLYFSYLILHRHSSKIKTYVSGLLMLFGTTALYWMSFDMRSPTLRLITWWNSLELVNGQNILFGEGINSFYQLFLGVMPIEVFEFEEFFLTASSPHNEMLQILLERGLFGLLTYSLPIIFGAYLLLKGKIRSVIHRISIFSLIAYYISVQFGFSTVEHLVVTMLFWSVLIANSIKFETLKFKFQKLAGKLLIAGTLIILGISSLIYGLNVYKADKLLAKGVDSYITNPERSFEYLQKANSILPMYSLGNKISLSLFKREYNKESDLKSTLDSNLDRLGVVTNYNYEYHLFAMELSAKENRFTELDYHLLEAKKLAPNLPKLYTTAGDLYFENMDCSSATSQYEKLLELAPKRYLDNIDNCQEVTECRLFKKHAPAFIKAMENLDYCRGLNLED